VKFLTVCDFCLQRAQLGGGGGLQQSGMTEERDRITQLVQLQAQEIDSLKDEILLLSRKGGHVMPPSQPPPPTLPRLGSRGATFPSHQPPYQ